MLRYQREGPCWRAPPLCWAAEPQALAFPPGVPPGQAAERGRPVWRAPALCPPAALYQAPGSPAQWRRE